MGEVWLAWDRKLLRHVALKAIHAHLGIGTDLVSRFEAEAQATAQLQHPSIVPVHDVGMLPDGRPYYTMRVVTGQELRTLIDAVHTVSTRAHWGSTEDGLSFLDLCDAFQQVCEAVAWAHSRGVVHRDLKPANVMVGDFGQVLVVDWGLAKVVGSTVDHPTEETALVQTSRSEQPDLHTRHGRISGSPGYMAPEQARGDIEAIGPRSDVFALGGILFTMLAGRAPTPDEEPATALAAFPRIDQRLRELCIQSMEPHPADRPADAAVLAERFGAWRRGAHEAAQQASVVSHAESAYRDLPDALQAAAPALLVRLVGPEGDARPTSREAAPPDLVNALVAAEVLNRDPDEIRLLDPALARSWDRLRGWVEGDRIRHQRLHLLIEAARGWASAGRPDRLLWSDRAEVSAARRMSVARTPEEDDFLARSARHLVRQRTRARVVASIVAVAIVAAGIMSAVQWRSASEARNREATARQVAETRALVSEGQRRTQDGTPLAAAITLHGAGERASDPEYRSELLDRARTLQAAARGSSAVLRVHDTRINGLDWSPSGHRVASGDVNGFVRVWSPSSLQTIWSRRLDPGVNALYWSPRGDTIVVATMDGAIRVLDPETGATVSTLPSDQGWRPALRYLADGRLLTARPEGTLLVVQPATGEVLQELQGHEHYVFDADVHEETGRLATASVDMTVRLWDLETGRQTHQLQHPVQLLLVRHALDGRRIVSIGTEHTVAWLWDAATGRLLTTLEGHKQKITSLTISPDSKTILTMSEDGTSRLWNAEDGSLRDELPAHGEAAWSPDGRLLALANPDGQTLVFDARTGGALGRLPTHPEGIMRAAWDTTGQRLVTAGIDGTIRISHPLVARIRTTKLCEAGIYDWDVSEDQRWLAVASARGRVCVVDLEEDAPASLIPSTASWVLWAPIGDRLVFGTSPSKATPPTSWQPNSPEPMPLTDMAHLRGAARFLSDGRRVVGVSDDYTLDTHDVRTGERLSTLDTGKRILLSRMEADRLLVWNHDHSAEVWDLASGRRLVHSDDHDREWGATALAHSGGWVVWEAPRGVIRRVDLDDAIGPPPTRWETPVHVSVLSIAIDDAGRWVGAILNDRTAVLMDATTGRIHTRFPTPGAVAAIDFSATGDRVLVQGKDGSVAVRQTRSGRPLLSIEPDGGGGVVGSRLLADGTLLTVNEDGAARRWPIPDPPVPLGALTNQRLCIDGRVLPIAPWPDRTTVWAPQEACAAPASGSGHAD
jgi:WD40 repeat protein/serine/threonine protein kinase